MEEENLNPETLTQEVNVASGDGEGQDDSVVIANSEENDALSLKELNTLLGKDFKDKDSALKSLKDTQSYVGKVGQLEKELKETKTIVSGQDGESPLAGEVKELRDDLFFSKHPEYEPYRSTIKLMGNSPEEIVAKDEFKVIFDKASSHDKNLQTKSILQSNPRIGKIKDKMTTAREALTQSQRSLAEGDPFASAQSADIASESAIEAVLDSLEN